MFLSVSKDMDVNDERVIELRKIQMKEEYCGIINDIGISYSDVLPSLKKRGTSCWYKLKKAW